MITGFNSLLFSLCRSNGLSVFLAARSAHVRPAYLFHPSSLIPSRLTGSSLLFPRLNNTWTPLVGGILTARLGTPLASIIATSLIFGGQLLVLLSSGSGDGSGSVKGMAFGLWVFGLGVSPLAVVQEVSLFDCVGVCAVWDRRLTACSYQPPFLFKTIIVRYFSNHGLGVSLALGLVAGKGASFVSSITSFPLSEKYGSRGPFVVSSLLAGCIGLAIN